MTNFIPFALHDIGEDDINEVVDTLRSSWITTGPKTQLFEKNFAEYIGTKYAVAVNSATAGLHLGLEAIGLKAGDKVITTPYTFAATAEVIRYFNADPIFIDIRESNLNIDVDKITRFCNEECHMKEGMLYHNDTSSRVKAIMPVHIAGLPCEMDSLTDVAKRHNLKIIEDAAHALPSNYKGKKIGSISDITVFSFYATKTITTAEGGMVVTNDPAIYDRIKVMRFHGIDRNAWDRYGSKIPKWYYEIIDAGFKYNMTDVAASLGIQQLKKVDIFYEKRRRIASIYDKELKSIDGIELPVFDSNDKSHSWHLYIIRLDQKKFNRNVFIEKLYEKGIGASVHFIPLHIHPYYRDKYGFKPEDFPVSYDCYKKVVSIPIYTKLNDSEIDKIISSIRDLSQ